MRFSIAARSTLLFGALMGVHTAAAETELKNDGFTGNGQVSVQGGFYNGEIGASRFVASGPTQLVKVRLFFGSTASTRTVTLHVWDDSGGGAAPGPQLFDGDFDLTGSSNALNEIDLSAMPVAVPAQFRVGIEFHGPPDDMELGEPAMARDFDGTIAQDRNYLYAYDLIATYTWARSYDLGLRGDWILRAVVADPSGSPDAGVTPDASTGGPDASTGPDAGSGGQCNGNGDCEVGEYCDTAAHACTFDCRHDTDCPGDDQCNSLGQCVGATGDGGGGCCSTGEHGGAGGGEAALGALGLAGLVGFAVTRRRRATGARVA